MNTTEQNTLTFESVRVIERGERAEHMTLTTHQSSSGVLTPPKGIEGATCRA